MDVWLVLDRCRRQMWTMRAFDCRAVYLMQTVAKLISEGAWSNHFETLGS